MKLKDFYDLVNYANKAWKGFFSLQERMNILHEIYAEYKHSLFCKKLTHTMQELLNNLKEDGSAECIGWYNRILGSIMEV